MANQTVRLYYYAKVNGMWTRGPAAIRKNGKIAPETMLLAGKEVQGLDGHYETISYRGTKPIRVNVGTDPVEALLALEKTKNELRFRNLAHCNGYDLPELEKAQRRTLQHYKTEFTKEKELEEHKSDDSSSAHKTMLNEFLPYAKKVYPADITTSDLLGYAKWLTETNGYSEATRANRMARCFSFLKYAGIDVLKPEEKPLLTKAQKAQLLRYTKKLPTIYEPDELSKMMAAAGRPQNRALMLFAVSTGFRDQEIQYLEWDNINYEAGTVSVVAKPQLGFSPKDGEERTVPLTPELSQTLKELQSKQPKSHMVFCTQTKRRNKKLLDIIKRVARRAGVNCGRCDGCKARHECYKFTLHKFRRTYITRILRQTDLRTAMYLAGHSDISSTMRYIRPSEGQAVQKAVFDALKDLN